jgi:hypothetical protein
VLLDDGYDEEHEGEYDEAEDVDDELGDNDDDFDDDNDEEGTEFGDDDDEAWWWVLKEESTSVLVRSDSRLNAQTLTVSTPNCIGCIEFRELERKDEWIKALLSSNEGVHVRGWIQTSKLERLARGSGGGFAGGCNGDHDGGGGWGEAWAGGKVPDGLYEGVAIIKEQTKVYSAPPKGHWGTFREETKVKIRYLEGEPWVELRNIPGLDGSPIGAPWLNASVSVNDVEFETNRVSAKS